MGETHAMADGKRDGYSEVEASRRAVEIWGEERAVEIEGTIEDAAR